MHKAELQRQSYLTHGRIDGPIPPKKRKEFEKWQDILRSRSENSGARAETKGMLTDSADFSESGWREMGRGAGESARAFEFRTGIRNPIERKSRKRPGGQNGVDDTNERVAKMRGKRPGIKLSAQYQHDSGTNAVANAFCKGGTAVADAV